MSRALPYLVSGVLLTAAIGTWSPTRAALTASAAGPVTVIGSVVDGMLTPIANATVTLEQGSRVTARTTSDAQGKFRFTAVPPGQYRMRATRSGFPVFLRELKISGEAPTVQVPVVLVSADEARKENASQTGTAAPSPPPLPAATPMAAAGGGRGSQGALARIDEVQPASRAIGEIAVSDANLYSAGPGPRQESWLPEPAPWGTDRNAESYRHVRSNQFQSTRTNPLSTFGADVDTASYTNVRRFLSRGQLPPRDAVRVEELINYFRFGYAVPQGRLPLSLRTEVGDCPWDAGHQLVLIGARARNSSPRAIEGRNITLLLDVSGSMAPADRLPMIKTALGMFVDTLRPDDRLAIVTYAGTSGVALPSTPVRQRETIQRAIASLSAGGSTNGAQGLVLAYRIARQAFIPGGVNRVILATDGDFNVGVTSQQELLRLIQRERESGVFLSVFGVGTGNLKDSTMEMLADKGNGHYAYLDSFQEARRMLVREADGTLETVAKDVKFQVEFNPATVSSWKLIGYENRALAAEDFNDDQKDGGEMGAGHTVTVLYEVVPVSRDVRLQPEPRPQVDPLRYGANLQVPGSRPTRAANVRPSEWLTVKARFKLPEGETSEMISQSVVAGQGSQYLPFAAAVAEFGLLLRDGAKWTGHWESLANRVSRMSVPEPLMQEKNGFAELVSIAAALNRGSRGE
jgi:Ca-activated chloride channel family protein